MKLILSVFAVAVLSVTAFAGEPAPNPAFYRNLTLRIRNDGAFRIFMPGGVHQDIRYSLKFGSPVYANPLTSDLKWSNGKGMLRSFWDRIMTTDDSFIEMGGEKLPLTCVFVDGQDNRFSGDPSPLFPEFIMKIYFVANDFACQGPIRPGWPTTGGRKENWDTYLQYIVRDPTIMLPTDAIIRYRWNEASAVLIDNETGGK